MFTYQFGANPRIDYVRLLIGDTQCENHIFEDAEIESFHQINRLQFQSGMFYSGSMGKNLPDPPTSYLRAAAMALDAIAGSRSRMGGVTKLLDVTLDIGKVASSLRDQANQWREIDDNSGAFMIIEQCTTSWGFLQRFYSQIQRQVGT